MRACLSWWPVALVAWGGLWAQDYVPGSRVLLDAHNCYPEKSKWTDRLDRALALGFPLAIEQDLAWVNGKSVVSHSPAPAGTEPGVREYFFDRVRPLMTRALAENRRSAWPLLALNLDFKTDEPEHHAAVWNLLKEHEAWLSWAVRGRNGAEAGAITHGPMLVLTGVSPDQERTFHDAVPIGGKLLVFGAVPVHPKVTAETPAGAILAGRRTNYRRWWNNPWQVVELGGQRAAGEWTEADESRLRALTGVAREAKLWIRFYTLNGHAEAEGKGWTASYNFGSAAAARQRWSAAVRAGVDFIATDQYEDLAPLIMRR